MTRKELMCAFPHMLEFQDGEDLGRWHARAIREIQRRLRSAREEHGDLSSEVFNVLYAAEEFLRAVLQYRNEWHDDMMCDSAACSLSEDFDAQPVSIEFNREVDVRRLEEVLNELR